MDCCSFTRGNECKITRTGMCACCLPSRKHFFCGPEPAGNTHMHQALFSSPTTTSVPRATNQQTHLFHRNLFVTWTLNTAERAAVCSHCWRYSVSWYGFRLIIFTWDLIVIVHCCKWKKAMQRPNMGFPSFRKRKIGTQYPWNLIISDLSFLLSFRNEFSKKPAPHFKLLARLKFKIFYMGYWSGM